MQTKQRSTRRFKQNLAACSLLTLLFSAGWVRGNPYPLSPILEGISWNEASKQRYAADSDLWDSAWASDDNVYAGWGDGEGFSGRTKSQMGFSQLSGSPAAGTL